METPDHRRADFDLADQLVAGASKEHIAEAARLLALHGAHCQLKFGVLPLENFTVMLRTQTINAETAELLSAGRQQLGGVLGIVLGQSWTKTMARRTFTSRLALLLVLALGLAACVFDRQVKHAEPASDGPTVYGTISVSVDRVSTR